MNVSDNRVSDFLYSHTVILKCFVALIIKLHIPQIPPVQMYLMNIVYKNICLWLFFLYIELSIPKLSSHIKYKYIKIITLKMVSFPVISITVPKWKVH